MAEIVIDGPKIPKERIETPQLVTHFSDWLTTLDERVSAGLLTAEQEKTAISRTMAALYRGAERMGGKAYTDSLTKQPNRRAFDREYHRLTYRPDVKPFGLLLVDIDRFKLLNDRLGHQAGNSALAQVALTLETGVKQSDRNPEEHDFIARYGGEEFAVLIKNVSEPQQLLEIAERLRGTLDKLPLTISYLDKKQVRVTNKEKITVSVGGAIFRPGTDREDFVTFVDAGLYEAKGRGRNNSVVIGANNNG